MLYKLIVKKDRNDFIYQNSDFVFDSEHYLISNDSILSEERLNSFLEKEYGVYISSYYLDKLIRGNGIESSIYQFELQSIKFTLL